MDCNTYEPVFDQVSGVGRGLVDSSRIRFSTRVQASEARATATQPRVCPPTTPRPCSTAGLAGLSRLSPGAREVAGGCWWWMVVLAYVAATDRTDLTPPGAVAA